jgi:hypothetical protein
MTSLKIKDFGPIAEGSVDLKPLTVFIGPNNSGKSYMSLLVYALSRVGAGSAIPGQWGEIFDKVLTSGIPLEELPEATSSGATPDAGPPASKLRDELRRCFGAEIQELVRRGDEPGPDDFSIALPFNAAGVDLQLEARSRDSELEQVEWGEGIDILLGKLRQVGHSEDDLESLLDAALTGLVLDDLDRPHYLPASRTGILLGHRVLASLIVGQASLAWVRPIEIPRLTGAVTDLIQSILLLNPQRDPGDGIKRVVDYVEREITGGRVGLDMGAEYPEIYFEDTTGRYRLNQVSSTVSELAPLVLFLKYVVSEGERLIIEEPESHLDAGHQRHLASAIAMLVNAGVNVLVTTHSDYLLSQINNLLLASGFDADHTKDYDASEMLEPEQVGAYFFNPGEGGTRIEEMEVTREDGISVDWFSRIYEALYDEAIRLQYKGTQPCT